MSQSVTGMLRFSSSWPASAGAAQAAQKAVSSAAAGTEASAVRVGPSLSQAYPPRLLPAKTNMAVRNERPAPAYGPHGNGEGQGRDGAPGYARGRGPHEGRLPPARDEHGRDGNERRGAEPGQ